MYTLCIEQLLANTVTHKDKTALISVTGQPVTYGELLWHISGVRERFQEMGIGRGDYVILSASKTFGFVYAYFALHSLGAVCAPVDPQSTSGRLTLLRNFLKPKAQFWTEAGNGMEAITVLDALASDNTTWQPTVSAADLADVMFTSGTTGIPKCACITHGNLAYAVNNINMFIGNTAEDVEINPMPLSHSFGLARMRCTLYVGATMVLIDGVSRPKALFHAMNKYGVTGIGMVAPAWTVLKRLSGDKMADYKNQLRYVEFGSAPMPAQEKAHLASLLPHTRVCMHYGATEASRAIFQEFHEDADHLDSVGCRSPLTEVAIINAEGEHLGFDQEGEVCVKGGMVSAGYLGMDSALFFWGDYFRTGDLGYRRNDGHVVLTGRITEIINVGGRKVNPSEVDQALIALPGIQDAACVAAPDPLAGEVVAACLVASGDKRFELDEIRSLLRGIIEEYKLPARLLYVDAIPKTNSGKIQRLELKAKFRQ